MLDQPCLIVSVGLFAVLCVLIYTNAKKGNVHPTALDDRYVDELKLFANNMHCPCIDEGCRADPQHGAKSCRVDKQNNCDESLMYTPIGKWGKYYSTEPCYP